MTRVSTLMHKKLLGCGFCVLTKHNASYCFYHILRPRQNCCHFADNISKCIFLNENLWISLKISLKFVPKVQIDNIPTFVQIITWCQPGDKPLFEPMMLNLLMYICITQASELMLVWNIHPRCVFASTSCLETQTIFLLNDLAIEITFGCYTFSKEELNLLLSLFFSETV